MEEVRCLTRDGTPWTPEYLDSIDPEQCIGCGRCFKVCAQDVMEAKAVTEDGDIVDADDDEAERMIMTVANKGACTGCAACARVCGKNAQRHVGPDAPLAT
jgi:Nif-specific ferredoxin III